jgi:uncharacterized protein YjiK
LKKNQKLFATLKNRRIFAPGFIKNKNTRMLYRTTNIPALSILNIQNLDVNGYLLSRMTNISILNIFNTQYMGVGTILAERERERESTVLACTRIDT